MSEQKATDWAATDSEGEGAETLSRTLDGWRARIDDLLVQVDLAGMEIRDRVRKDIDITENVYLAARSRLSDARGDAHTDMKTACRGTERLIDDLQQAFHTAEAAFHRGRTN